MLNLNDDKREYTDDGFEIAKEDYPEGMVKLYGICDEYGKFLGFSDSKFPEIEPRMMRSVEEATAYMMGFTQALKVSRRYMSEKQKDEAGHIGLFGMRAIVCPLEKAKEILDMQDSEGNTSYHFINARGKGQEGIDSIRAMRDAMERDRKNMVRVPRSGGRGHIATEKEIEEAENALLEALDNEDKEDK